MIAIALSACGGGGGGSAATGGGGSTTTSASISGLVGGGSGGAGASKAAGSASITSSPLLDAVVEILAFDKSGNLTDSENSNTLKTGTFSATLDLANAGGYVVINVTKAGYTKFSKRVDFESPADVNISAEIDSVLSTIVPLTTGNVTISSTGKRVISIALYKDSRTGRQSIVAGSAAAIRKQAGGNPTLQIDIAADPLMDMGVVSLKADMQSYNPSIANDVDAFPGDFVDSSGNKLVSSGFDYINITTDSGTGLANAVAAAVRAGRISKAAAEEPTYITRAIPQGVCKNLLRDASCAQTDASGNCTRVAEDANPGSDGFNVPIYTYNPRTGQWVLLGFGGLDINNDGIFNSADAGGDFDGNGIANIPGDDDLYTTGISNGVLDHNDYQEFCRKRQDPSDGYQDGTPYLNLIIQVTNEDFLTDWWNLDYPLVFEEPKELCVNLTFKDQNASPIQGIYASLWDNTETCDGMGGGDCEQSFSYAWGMTDSLGKTKLKVAQMDSTDTDVTAALGYWDPINYIYNTLTLDLGESPNNCTSQNITISKPTRCSVTGVVRDDIGNPMVNQYVYIYGSTDYYYGWAYTDSNGTFTADAKCGSLQDVYVGWDWQPKGRFTPNGVRDGSELSDTDPTPTNGEDDYRSTLSPIVFENMAPYVYGWLSTTFVMNEGPGGFVTSYIYGWDNECDTPMTWRVYDNGSLAGQGTWNDCWGYTEADLLLATGSHALVANVTDSKGKTGTYGLGDVTVAEGARPNMPPFINYAYGSAGAVAQEATITLYMAAYDLDGDDLYYSWSESIAGAGSASVSGSQMISGTFSTGCTGGPVAGSMREACTYTAPAIDGNITLTFTVDDDNDGIDAVSQSFDLYVGNLPSELQLIIQKKGVK